MWWRSNRRARWPQPALVTMKETVQVRKSMDRQQAHQLLDQLGPVQFDAIVKLLEVMVRDDSEDLTPEDCRAVVASRDYFRQNPEGGIPFEQVVADCGFTLDQLRQPQGE